MEEQVLQTVSDGNNSALLYAAAKSRGCAHATFSRYLFSLPDSSLQSGNKSVSEEDGQRDR